MSEENEGKRPRFVRVKRTRRRGPEEGAGEKREPSIIEGPPPERAGEESHTRIVVPRQERPAGGEEGGEADIELREVRYGSASRTPYLRVVPRQRMFTKVAPGAIEATQLGSRPRDIAGRYWTDIKRVFIGSPFATSRAIHERLSKVKALAILGSDPLSSSAYATEEMLIILALAGTAAFVYALPLAGVIAVLLAIVALSYRQTIKAYPSGGGAYIVAHENLGRGPGLTAAASLLVDYVLLVAVSVAAGVAAITSAVPDLYDARVLVGVAIVILLTLGNLRGIRESGSLFAAPTYLFILAMATMIIVGVVKVVIGDAPGSVLHAAPLDEREVVATQGITLFLVLRAFSSGGAALTGVEAISNGVPTFKAPESNNARTTLTVMAVTAIFLFLGVTFLTSRFGLVPSEDQTLVSELGRSVFGKNALYYGYQVATASVLFLAANTSFNAFPLLSAILSRDRFMPQQFSFKGDRLAFSNGILLLSAAAAVLLVAFQGDVTRLIPLYAVGVFVSFTLSQSGMVLRWWRLREPGWRASLLINGVGAVTTGVVAVIITTTKFVNGAWISILMMAVMILIFALIRRHYDWYHRRIEADERTLREAKALASVAEARDEDRAVVPVDELNRVTLAALEYARGVCPQVTAVHLTDDREAAEAFRRRWAEEVPNVPLLVIESPYRAFVAPMLAYIEALQEAQPAARVTVVMPRIVLKHWWDGFLHNQNAPRLKRHLLKRAGVRIAEFPYTLEEAAA